MASPFMIHCDSEGDTMAWVSESYLQLQQKCLHPLKNVFGFYLIYITLNITLKMFLEEFIS